MVDRGSILVRGSNYFFLSPGSDQLWGLPSFQMGTERSFPAVKAAGE
jgi:hypothetical protein